MSADPNAVDERPSWISERQEHCHPYHACDYMDCWTLATWRITERGEGAFACVSYLCDAHVALLEPLPGVDRCEERDAEGWS